MSSCSLCRRYRSGRSKMPAQYGGNFEAYEHEAYDRLPVIRYNEGYMLPTLEKAGETYAVRLAEGFDMQYLFIIFEYC